MQKFCSIIQILAEAGLYAQFLSRELPIFLFTKVLK